MKLYILITAVLYASTIKCLPTATDDSSSYKLNDRPIIAVLAQYTKNFPGYSYIAASYVKYLESVGARVIPIPESFSKEEVLSLFKHVNGVLFPGGGTKWFESSYYKNAVMAIATSMNAKELDNDHFPVWGTCLGFETLNVVIANSTKVLGRFAADDVSLPLNYTGEAKKSHLFKDISDDIYKAMESQDITYNHHSFGVSPETHDSNKDLKRFFKILSTSRGTDGKDFISSMEAYDFPIYGVQWHPEKNNFEFDPDLNIDHSPTGVQVSLSMANFFVNEARRSKKRFPSREMEQKYMIYRYKPTYTAVGNKLNAFEQIYLFK